ncbi:MAG: putative exported protein [Labilithrix sp.]|nr:putative exported protein [Labilithrix sp.]
MHRFAAGLAAALGAALVASPSGVDATVARSNGLANKKAGRVETMAPEIEEPEPLLGTLVQTHTDERVPLDAQSPSADRFARLLADRVTGESHELDPRLLELLRTIARRHPGVRLELVSGYRSPKLNEMMRKKGHHVASHSQHSLGHAVDFRVVVDPDSRGIDPRLLEKEIRELGWDGGIGVYTLASDWFVHCDVGRHRRWGG